MIKIEGLSYWYPETNKPALKEVSANFHAGEVVLLTGPNGGGKSTLLKTLTAVTTQLPGHRITGSVFVNNKSIANYQTYELSGKVGLVLQDPETQISNLTVLDEVSFGQGNLLFERDNIIEQSEKWLRLMGLEGMHNFSVLKLSGGQLQRLSIASLLAMKPDVLILDEPLSNLDPHGIASVVDAIKTLRSHTKLVIISTHILDPFLDLATRITVIDNGEIVLDNSVSNIKDKIASLEGHGVLTPDKWKLEKIIENLDQDWQPKPWRRPPAAIESVSLLELSSVILRYKQNGAKILENINLDIGERDNIALVGKNGEGKTTLIRLIARLIKPTGGNISKGIWRTAFVPQRPTLGFLYNTVGEELSGRSDLAERFGLAKYIDQSPFLLSGGEQRRLGLAIALSQNPQLLLLDESTAGLDSSQVNNFLDVLKNFEGTTIQITHDPRIVANNVDRVIMLHDHQIKFDNRPDLLTKEALRALGYDRINPTVSLLIDKQLEDGIALIPEQVEVAGVNISGREDALS